jgi:hypothetical protein
MEIQAVRRTIGLAGESTGSRTAKDIKYLGYDREGGEADVKRGRIKAEQGKRQSRSGEWQSRPGIHPYEGAPFLLPSFKPAAFAASETSAARVARDAPRSKAQGIGMIHARSDLRCGRFCLIIAAPRWLGRSIRANAQLSAQHPANKVVPV